MTSKSTGRTSLLGLDFARSEMDSYSSSGIGMLKRRRSRKFCFRDFCFTGSIVLSCFVGEDDFDPLRH